ncbi:FAD-binding oxidoreductase [Actinocorallia sp. A-T 12471]|uniref:FAD-binding oxidoreductase n=1 Tax=Actinocorallia sp. A-T 12471 TaxID=3089813 RepID=UPI0029CFBBFE|nr:FAD-binding oxidoreductase [Actinocorallia sp. A-T 12471]MDX6743473.1 FAD-binding oxidoreductase [Actinocorallia sp. A-T 12471]
MPDPRPAEPGEDILGILPERVVRPETVEEAAEAMRKAHADGVTVVPRGNGTRLHWGNAPRSCGLLLDTRSLDRVIEHAAGDLVVTVEAGLPVARLQELLAPARQQLALDSPLDSTVGGVLATASAGPRRLLYGTPRDLLIGVTVIRADGEIVKSGGKVVKNVAGYDLGKLYTGSFGTLGLIVRASFRLHPVPDQSVFVTAVEPDPLRAVLALLHSPLVPSAIEVDGAGRHSTVAALFEGSAAEARAAEAVRLLGGGARVAEEPQWWGRYPEAEVLLEVRAKPSELPEVLALGGSRIRGSAGSGVWFIGTFAASAPDLVARLRRRWTTVVRSAPPRLHGSLDLWGPSPALPLMRRVKDQFDPGHRLSPGRFLGGL